VRILRGLILGAFLFFLAGSAAFAQQTATQQLTLTVTAPVISIAPSTLPNVVINTPYNQSIVATGGVGPFTYSIAAGALPTGTTINSLTGVISGTPTVAGTYNFTVQAADSETPPATKTQAYTVIVIAKLVFTTTTIPATLIGQPYSADVAFTGGIGPYTCSVSAGSLPTGIALTTVGNNCHLAGTPTVTGAITFTLQVASAQ